MVMDGTGAAADAVSDARISGAELGAGCRFCLQDPCACFATMSPGRRQDVQASLDSAKQAWLRANGRLHEAAARVQRVSRELRVEQMRAVLLSDEISRMPTCVRCASPVSREAAMRACSAFHDLGNCFSDYGDARKAFGISLFELHFARDVLHDSVLECRALDRIGRMKTLLGFSGLQEHTTQLQIATANSDRAGQRLAWSGIGLSKRLNDAGECVKVHERELNLAKDLGDRAVEAEACGSLGLALLDVGRLQEAIDRLSEKLAIAQEMGIKAEEGRALLALGDVFLAKSRASDGKFEDLVKAARYREQAFEVIMVQNHTDILHEQLEVCIKVAELNPVFSSIMKNARTDHFEEIMWSGTEMLLQYVVRMTDPDTSSSASLLAVGIDSGVVWKQRRIRLLRAQAFCIYARFKCVKKFNFSNNGDNPQFCFGFQEMFVNFLMIKGSVEVEEPACGCCGRVASQDVKLNVCMECKVARFCSKACLKRSWKTEHKHVCPVLKTWKGIVFKGKPHECNLGGRSFGWNLTCEKARSPEGCQCLDNLNYLEQTICPSYWCKQQLWVPE